MKRLGLQFCASLAALAVLTVSVTCTQAGCLLPTGSRSSPAAHACCAGRTAQGSPAKAPLDGGRCRLCQSSMLINQSPSSAPPDLALHLLCLHLASEITTPISALTIAGTLDEPSPSVSPPTLLSLHCALLS